MGLRHTDLTASGAEWDLRQFSAFSAATNTGNAFSHFSLICEAAKEPLGGAQKQGGWERNCVTLRGHLQDISVAAKGSSQHSQQKVTWFPQDFPSH